MWNWWAFLGIPWECFSEGLDFQDALGLTVVALHPGWEDQDLGLPLLHVLGKNSGIMNKPESRFVESSSNLPRLEFLLPNFFNRFGCILDGWYLDI